MPDAEAEYYVFRDADFYTVRRRGMDHVNLRTTEEEALLRARELNQGVESED